MSSLAWKRKVTNMLRQCPQNQLRAEECGRGGKAVLSETKYGSKRTMGMWISVLQSAFLYLPLQMQYYAWRVHSLFSFRRHTIITLL